MFLRGRRNGQQATDKKEARFRGPLDQTPTGLVVVVMTVVMAVADTGLAATIAAFSTAPLLVLIAAGQGILQGAQRFSVLSWVLAGVGVARTVPGVVALAVGAGAATVDLRHLGAKRVLVLVDGIRWVNESSGSGVGAAVDLNTIPLALIERIEVLEDGASSIYGSDAIAGVVNIITRRDAQGGSLDLNYGEYQDLGGGTWGADLGWGGSNDRAQWFAGASYFRQREISSARFANASVPVPGTGLANGSSATPGGRFVFAPPGGNDTLGGHSRHRNQRPHVGGQFGDDRRRTVRIHLAHQRIQELAAPLRRPGDLPVPRGRDDGPALEPGP